MSSRINVSTNINDPSNKTSSPVIYNVDTLGPSDIKICPSVSREAASDSFGIIRDQSQHGLRYSFVIPGSCGSLSACSMPLSNSSSSMSSACSGGESLNHGNFAAASPCVGSQYVLSRSFSNRHRRKLSSESSDGVPDALLENDISSYFLDDGTCHLKTSSVFVSNTSMDLHVGSSFSPNSIPLTLSCSQCNTTFSTIEGQIDHMRNHHPLSTFICNICKSNIALEDTLKHIKRCKGSFQCSECSASFSSSSFLKKHIQRVHQCAEQWPCTLCGKVLATKLSLQNHMKQHSDESSKEFKCDFCVKSFIQRVHLQVHLDRHHGNKELASHPKNYHCDLCNVDYLYEGSWKHHMSWHRRKENSTKNHKCEACSMEFHSEAELVRHSQVHNYSTKFKGHRPFQCPICKAGFTRQYLASEHMISVHLDPSQMTCGFCGKSYLSNDSLRKHIQAKHSCRENEAPDLPMEIDDFENAEPPSRKLRDQSSWTKWYHEVEMSGIVDEAINDVIRDGNLKDIFSDNSLFSDSH